MMFDMPRWKVSTAGRRYHWRHPMVIVNLYLVQAVIKCVKGYRKLSALDWSQAWLLLTPGDFLVAFKKIVDSCFLMMYSFWEAEYQPPHGIRWDIRWLSYLLQIERTQMWWTSGISNPIVFCFFERVIGKWCLYWGFFKGTLDQVCTVYQLWRVLCHCWELWVSWKMFLSTLRHVQRW